MKLVDEVQQEKVISNPADNILFRASSSGYLMAKSKSETLSEGAKTHLIDVFVSEKYKRREEISSKYLEKGNECEEDSITLLSRISKIMYKKNTIRLRNKFVQGEPDLFLGAAIENADETIDTKSSWSAYTFFRSQKDKLNPLYYWQGQCYMWLTGAKKHTVAYCLVNGLADTIIQEKRLLSFKKGMLDFNGNPTEKFIDKCKQIEINHIFDLELFKKHNPYFEFDNDLNLWTYDIPKEERVFKFEFDRNEDDIIRLKNRIIDGRKYMNENLYK